jgi:demethylspheroidene O-methyltransferase
MAWRDRLLADPRFLRWSARFPLTRPVARRQAAGLFDLCAGFVYAQTLSACVACDLFDFLAERRATLAELAAHAGLPEPGMRALADAACGLDLLRHAGGGCYRLGLRGAAMRGNPGIAAMVRHHAMLYDDLRDPAAVLRQGGAQLGAYWPYAADAATATTANTGGYTALMAASQPMIAEAVLGAYGFARHRCLLDIGGGNGRFLELVGTAAPHLALMLLDLPPVAAAARSRLEATAIGSRLTCHGGDFTTADFPRGADIVSFVRVLHDHEDAVVARLLDQARAALPHNGRLLIAEPMEDDPRAAAYFHIYLRAMGSGRPRRARVLASLARRAGFSRPRLLPTHLPLLARVLIADCKS